MWYLNRGDRLDMNVQVKHVSFYWKKEGSYTDFDLSRMPGWPVLQAKVSL